MAANLLIADKAFDADLRVLQPLIAAGKSAVIPPRQHRPNPRAFDSELYKARHGAAASRFDHDDLSLGRANHQPVR